MGKRMRGRKLVISALLGILLVMSLAIPVSASISPSTVTATLNPGESVSTNKTVTIPYIAPKADVVFAFDLTGSMGGILSTAKTQASNIMASLAALPTDIEFGVMSYMDYPGYYDYCGYAANYGWPPAGDYAYSLDQAITSNTGNVASTIGGLVIGSGYDGPEDYERIFYESYADSAVGWRVGAKKVLVNFGDNVPHDCDLNEGVPGKAGTWTTGGDPGRNEIIGDGDDLDLQTVLAEMAANGVVLLECHTEYPPGSGKVYSQDWWEYWTGLTGGGLYVASSANLTDDVVAAVTAGLTVPEVDGLHLEAESGYETWLTSVSPSKYDDVLPGESRDFEETITVPGSTLPGVYVFTVSALDDKGVTYGDQTVTITVPGGPVPPPPVPSMTQWGIIATVLILAALTPLALRRRSLSRV